jgi:8-oxo-dGTP diphosphatase
MRNTTLCHIEKDGKYLMLHRVKKENDLNHDKWVGIGGKFEDKESPEQCNRREVLEETGLTLNSSEYRGIVTFVSDKWETEYMHIFTSNDFSGEIIECDEGDLVWIDKKELLTLPLWVGDKIFLKLIEDKSYPFFSLRLEYCGESLVSAILNDKELDIGEVI